MQPMRADGIFITFNKSLSHRKSKKTGPPHAQCIFVLVGIAQCAVLSRAYRGNASFCAIMSVNARKSIVQFNFALSRCGGTRSQHNTLAQAASTPHANAIIERRKPLISCIYYSIYIYAHFSTAVIGPRSLALPAWSTAARIYRSTWAHA